MSRSNERSVERIEVRMAVQVGISGVGKTTTRTVEAEICNLSEKGAYIRSDMRCEVGQWVTLQIQFTGPVTLAGKATTWENLRGTAIHAEGRKTSALSVTPALDLPKDFSSDTVIRWKTPEQENSNTGFGVEFTDLDPASQELLRRIIRYYQILRKAGVQFD